MKFLILFCLLISSIFAQYPPPRLSDIIQRTNRNDFKRFDTIVVYLDFYFAAIDDLSTRDPRINDAYEAGRSFIDLNNPLTYRRYRSTFYPVVDEFSQLQVPREQFGVPVNSTNPFTTGIGSTGGMFKLPPQEVLITLTIGNFTTAVGLDSQGNINENRTALCNPSFGNIFSFTDVNNQTVNLTGTDGFVCDSNQGPRWWRYPDPAVQATDLNEYFTSFLTAVVNVDGGKIDSIVWDDSCSSCGGSDPANSECIRGFQCGLSILEIDCDFEPSTDSTTIQTVPGNTNCAPRVFLTWIGTDGRSDECTSFSSAPSQFELYSANPVFRSASQSTRASFI